MQIKRFEAKNMTEALRQIKRELGPEAVILSAQDIRKENRLLGITRKIGVEVTAAVDGALYEHKHQALPRQAHHSAAAYGRTAKPAQPEVADHLRGGIHDVVRLSGSKHSAQRVGSDSSSGLGRRSSQALKTSATVSGTKAPGSANRKTQDPKRHQENGLAIMPWPFADTASQVVALVGNAGVGKTTTIAKLAARLQHEEGLRVGLISLDREKIGAVEQLQIYANILQIPLEIPQTEKDLKKALKKLAACNVVLVDTPAIGARKEKRPAVFAGHMRQIQDLKVWLVIGADNRIDNMHLTAELGADLNISAAIVTKTDLVPHLGGVLHFLSTAALPVVCMANGPEVPKDLSAASFDLFGPPLMPAAKESADNLHAGAPAVASDAEGQYLANRNSDIFHRAGCKWIRLINTENIRLFSSFADALNNRFKPCRYCNPQHLSITGMLHQERAAR
ncbi:MAG: Ada metal-binding domain-containing protein [Desulfobacterales bacterium]|nr:Ada metal-binding domain-containing protein [Desulfobacterales bacterium]MDJ0882571.1 Ada metal-binding domain-containing protein [Desulfobacterales bacterium]